MFASRFLRWGRAAVGVLGMLAVLLLAVPQAEARFRVKLPILKPRSAPAVNKPHSAPPRPDAPKVHSNLDAASRISVPVPARPPDSRGLFRRIWDWVLGRKPEAVPVPPAPAQPAPQAVAKATAPPATNVVVPVVPNRVMPISPPPGVQATAQDQEREKRRVTGPGGSLQKASANIGSEPQRGQNAGTSTAAPEQSRPAPKPSGYILHLTNGRAISVSYYEVKGDEVVIPQTRGSYGFHKSLIARIEPQGLEGEALTAGGTRR